MATSQGAICCLPFLGIVFFGQCEYTLPWVLRGTDREGLLREISEIGEPEKRCFF